MPAAGPPATPQADNLRALWQAGRLRWRLLPQARIAYDGIRNQWGKDPYLINCHRNFTKSTLGLTVADEECRRAPRTPCAIVCDTKAHALSIVEEKYGEYLSDCPEEMRPKVHLGERGFSFVYPNGSRIWIFGADDHRHVKTLRGLGFRFVFVDEGGHVDGSRGVTLKVIVRSILLPALAKFTRANPARRGQLVIATTSPMDEVHDFWTLWDEADEAHRFLMPLEANPDFSEEYKASRARECGGVLTVDYRREYGCERISLADAVPLPQVTQARLDGTDGKPALVRALPLPDGPREWYVAMDIGGRHLTGLVWGWYDHATNTIAIVREYASNNVTTVELSRDIKATEADLWRARPEYLDRWADNNNVILLHDLDVEHGLQFYPTRKDEKAAQLGDLRREISEGRIAIDPDCARLILTLRKARWKQSATKQPQWDYSQDIGHADLLDALLYLVRNVRRRAYPTLEHTVYDAAGIAPAELVGLKTQGMRNLARRLRDSADEPLRDYDA